MTYISGARAPGRPVTGLGRCVFLRPMDVLRIIAAILLPPLGVFLQVGLNRDFWINVILTILGYVPGIIHAIYIILKVP